MARRQTLTHPPPPGPSPQVPAGAPLPTDRAWMGPGKAWLPRPRREQVVTGTLPLSARACPPPTQPLTAFSPPPRHPCPGPGVPTSPPIPAWPSAAGELALRERMPPRAETGGGGSGRQDGGSRGPPEGSLPAWSPCARSVPSAQGRAQGSGMLALVRGEAVLSTGSKKRSSSCWKRGQTAKALLAPPPSGPTAC